MIRVFGKPDIEFAGSQSTTLADEIVPAGATQLRVERIDGFQIGQRVLITRPSTGEWITAIGMDREGIAWKPGTRDVRWERRIVDIVGNSIRLDAPVTTALERRYGGARVETFAWPGRLSQCRD